MPPTDLLRASGIELAKLIRDGELSSREVVDHFIERIERVNPKLNAVVKTRYAEARQEADAADARLRTSREGLPPFHGVPCTIKECFELTGMPNAAGVVARKDIISAGDATAVARIRAAGAIPLGVTNTSELCMWFESNNYVYGRTNNPYDVRRTAGGSSGGEGSIIGSGASPFGLGSDIGGSIRGPSFFNGIFGHKATGGVVPWTGQYPHPPLRANRFLSSGPMARRAEDLMPLLRVFAGPDGHDAGCREVTLGDPAKVDFKNLTVIDVEDDDRIGVTDDLRRAQAGAARALVDRGAKVRKMKFKGLKLQFEIWSAMLGEAQEESFGSLASDAKPFSPIRELLKWAIRRSDYTAAITIIALVAPVPKLLPRQAASYIANGRKLKAELVDAIGPNGVMLYPSYSKPAPLHNGPFHDLLRFHFPFGYLAVMNVMELPVTQTPLGLNAQGVPLGVQVVGTHGNDHLTIGVAMELERAFGGWVPPRMALS